MKPSAVTPGLILLLAVVVCCPAIAQWHDDPVINTPVCTASNQQNVPAISGDGAGGAIMVWADQRNGSTTADIYAQRLDIDGNEVWANDGIAVCITPITRSGKPKVLEDGAGGAFIAWHDYRSGNADIYAQRVDGSGSALWTVDGVGVCTDPDDQWEIQLVSDGAGGVIVVWKDFRTSGVEDIYAQRVNGSGNMLWAANGVPVCTATDKQEDHQAVSDGAGGVIMVWEDYRGDPFWNGDIYLQRLDSSGMPLWTVDGVAACTDGSSQGLPQLVSDNTGGAICSWEDNRNGSRVYAQRINGAGSVVWTTDGARVGGTGYSQIHSAITTDGDGGAIITWVIESLSTYFDIYAQRLDTMGTALWTAGGKPVCTNASSDQWGYPLIASDGAGGALITWEDYRNGEEYDIYGQRVDPTGDVVWASQGLAIATAPGLQAMSCITANRYGGVILAWSDFRSGISDIYAQQVTADGILGGINPTVNARLTCFPDMGPLPFSSQITVTLDNLYTGQTRRMAAVIDVTLASGAVYGNWRAGFTNIAAGGEYTTSWNQNFPVLGTLVGLNQFDLLAVDVTPAPYNQPPYPFAGDTSTTLCTILGYLK